MTTALSDSTLERFREAAAGGGPTPAGVAIAAVSASFAFGVLAKALTVSVRRQALAAAAARLDGLAGAARIESTRMLQWAAEDTAAFEAYLESARLPGSSETERLERRRALDSAVSRTIELPLAAARSAIAGLQLCGEALSLTHPVVLADLGCALTLLQGALRAFLLCAESNVRQMTSADSAHRARLEAESGRCRHALRQSDEVLEAVGAALAAVHPRARH
jgi:formiminotetrahydrofolate cyclodeaminase